MKQSLKKLAQQNVQLSNIEITDNNIKAFEKVAKKYGIDFSLKRDKSVDPPRYFVFFKARMPPKLSQATAIPCCSLVERKVPL